MLVRHLQDLAKVFGPQAGTLRGDDLVGTSSVPPHRVEPHRVPSRESLRSSRQCTLGPCSVHQDVSGDAGRRRPIVCGSASLGHCATSECPLSRGSRAQGSRWPIPDNGRLIAVSLLRLQGAAAVDVQACYVAARLHGGGQTRAVPPLGSRTPEAPVERCGPSRDEPREAQTAVHRPSAGPRSVTRTSLTFRSESACPYCRTGPDRIEAAALVVAVTLFTSASQR